MTNNGSAEKESRLREWYEFGPSRILPWKVDHPDDLGQSWHICRDFLDPLVEILQDIAKTNYDCTIEDIWPLVDLGYINEYNPATDAYDKGCLRARTFLELNTPAHFSEKFAQILIDLGKEAYEFVSEARKEAREIAEKSQKRAEPDLTDATLWWWRYDASIYLDYLEPCIEILRQMSAELKRRWPIEAAPADEINGSGAGSSGGSASSIPAREEGPLQPNGEFPAPPISSEVRQTIDADPLMKRIILYLGDLNKDCPKKLRMGNAIAKALRKPYSGDLKAKLATLRKLEVFCAGQGYPLSEKGMEIYTILKDRTKSS